MPRDANFDLDQSILEVSRGRLPLHARERLQEVAGPQRQLFTSDLSVSEFLLVQDAGCKPIAQVMGCSIYHIGKIPDYKGATGVIDTISDGHRQARALAISRLAQEAELVAADAVVGVRLDERLITTGARGKGGDDGDEIIEFTVIGTAVSASWLRRANRKAVLTDLSGQDVWTLYQEGFQPTGLLFDFCRYHVWHVLKGWSSSVIDAAGDAVDQARIIVTQNVQQQARQLGAEFVVGNDLKIRAKEVPCGFEGCELNDLDVDVSWFATGIARLPGGPQKRPHDIPPLILGMNRLGRAKADDLLDGDDDSREVEKRAEEMEKAAGGEGGGE